MCQYSLEGYKTRKAKEGETVYVADNHGGAFVSERWGLVNHRNGICVPYNTTCTLERLEIRRHWYVAHDKRKKLDELIGKTVVATLVGGSNRGRAGHNGDTWQFENGLQVPSFYVVSPVYIGVKPQPKKVEHKTFRGRKQFDAHLEKWPPSKKGVAAIEAAIDEAIKTAPAETPVRKGVRRILHVFTK